MKIEGNRPNPAAGIDDQLDVNRTAAAKTGDPKRLHDAAGLAGGDTVQVSSGAKLAAAAIDAAQSAPDVRPDKVARGKALLASGQLGADSTQLADSLIDKMLEE